MGPVTPPVLPGAKCDQQLVTSTAERLARAPRRTRTGRHHARVRPGLRDWGRHDDHDAQSGHAARRGRGEERGGRGQGARRRGRGRGRDGRGRAHARQDRGPRAPAGPGAGVEPEAAARARQPAAHARGAPRAWTRGARRRGGRRRQSPRDAPQHRCAPGGRGRARARARAPWRSALLRPAFCPRARSPPHPLQAAEAPGARSR